MSVNLLDGTIPYTELYERVMTMARLESLNNEDFLKGLVNDVYVRVLPRLYDWNPIIKSSSIKTIPWYTTGTVSVALGTTSVTGVGTAWTSDMTAANGWKIKFPMNEIFYDFTYASPTTATISPSTSGITDITGSGYYLVKDEYPLASDFDRFLRNGSFYVIYEGLQRENVAELNRDRFMEEFYPYPNDPIWRVTLSRTQPGTGLKMVWVNPAPRLSRNYPYAYIPRIAPMRDYRGYLTNSSAAVTNGSDVVTGTDTFWLANVAAGDYFRIDQNGRGDSSKWYVIASVDSDTQLTLSENYGEGTEGGMEYTCSKAPSPVYPPEFHEFILYDSCMAAIGTEGDQTYSLIKERRADILNGLYKNYKSRRTNDQFGVYDGGYR